MGAGRNGVVHERVWKPTGFKVQQQLRQYFKNNNNRCKIRILRGFLLYTDNHESIEGRCWRYFWESDNTVLPIPGALVSGWMQIDTRQQAKALLKQLRQLEFEVHQTPNSRWIVDCA